MIDFEYLRKQLTFWPYLTYQEVSFFKERVLMHTHKKGEVIFCGDAEIGLVVVKKGSLCVFSLSEEGREMMLFRLHENDVCVLSTSIFIHDIDSNVCVEFEKDCESYILNMTDYGALCNTNMYVENYTFKVLAHRFSKVIQTMQTTIYCDLEKRLAMYLLEEMDRIQSDSLKTTHEQIARHIGSAREAVSRVLKKFENQSIVSLSRKEIILLNPIGLKNIIYY